ncbi:MAG TPA: serine hydroxymethyltransferase [Syntrophales bacterium]|nr:serine hydroxymethyltransferase [Syntrophales bacterium]
MNFPHIRKQDPAIYRLIKQEEEKQQYKLSMIPSENFSSPAVREALSSVFVHKYAEGYAHKRYYEGNQFVDNLEELCIKRARKAFTLPDDWHVNVQPLAGGNSNLAVYNGLLETGDTILSMYLPDGGHLSHGWSFPEKEEQGLGGQVEQAIYLGGKRKISIVSKIFKVVQYKVEPHKRLFDYDKIAEIAKEYRPKMIISGGTAYPREINYDALSAIARQVGAYYLADIAHEAGLVAAGANKSPVGKADIVTFTTHKTIRGPRGAVILCRGELAEKIDFGVFPGLQGGPFEHTICSLAVCLKEAATPAFKRYAFQVVKNAKRLAHRFMEKGYDVVSGGTDKHLVLIDLRNKNLSGRNPARALDVAGIIMNRNSVPNETGSPMNPSGLRMGTPTVTTRGMKEKEMDMIAGWVDRVINLVAPYCDLKPAEFEAKIRNMSELKKTAVEVKALCKKYPLDMG